MPFTELGLSAKVLAAVEAAGYTSPPPSRRRRSRTCLRGRDIIGIAQTGTGKTASFVLPMLTLLEKGRARARMPRTLILEPTRELAAQVEENFEQYGKNHKLTVALLIGGVSFDDQNKKLDRGADVLIATPGRLLDHFERGRLLLTGVEILVIDEADRMLDMGFIPDIERICKLLPFTRQTLFFSATMPPEIQRLTEQFLQRSGRRSKSHARHRRPTTIDQKLRRVSAASRRTSARSLRQLIRAARDCTNAIIFCNRKRDVATLAPLAGAARLQCRRAAWRHGPAARAWRRSTDFRAGELNLLVASDVAARGLDIPAVSHVFNFDVPTHAEDYVHRIGRTGRAGRAGTRSPSPPRPTASTSTPSRSSSDRKFRAPRPSRAPPPPTSRMSRTRRMSPPRNAVAPAGRVAGARAATRDPPRVATPGRQRPRRQALPRSVRIARPHMAAGPARAEAGGTTTADARGTTTVLRWSGSGIMCRVSCSAP